MIVDYVLPLFKKAFGACAVWTNDLLTAVGGKGVVLAAFTLVLVIGLLFIPLRGFSIVDSGAIGAFGDFTRHVMYKPKHSNGKFVKGNSNYKGKFEKRPAGGHRASPR